MVIMTIMMMKLMMMMMATIMDGWMTEPLSSSADHFARGENESSGTRFPDAHDDRCKTFRIVLCIAGMQGNLLQVEFCE